jgi:hypothetical protein
LAQAEPPGGLAHEGILHRFHALARGGRGIIMALEMQQAVRQVTDDFLLPTGAKAAGLAQGFVNADEDFSMQGAAMVSSVTKRQDVGRSGVVQIGLIQPRHFSGANQEYPDPKVARTGLIDERRRNGLEQPAIDGPGALPVADVELTHRVAGRGVLRKPR